MVREGLVAGRVSLLKADQVTLKVGRRPVRYTCNEKVDRHLISIFRLFADCINIIFIVVVVV